MRRIWPPRPCIRLAPLAALALAAGAAAQPGPGPRARPLPMPVFEQAARRDAPAPPQRPACDEVNDSLLGAIAGGLLGRAGPRGGFGPGTGPMAGHGPGRGCR